MEEMKNLVIQTLETRGVLGQIRAKLRSSVFKIVDDQDQKSNPPMGCGLKWENPLLYKIRDTNSGGLIAELIREFMEHLKMDYSLSVFIPECSISPERLKRDEMLARLGVNPNNFRTDLPIIYFIIFYFVESLQSQPERVYQSLNNMGEDMEKISDDIIMRNLYNYQANMNDPDEQLNNNDRINVQMEERKVTEERENEALQQQQPQNKKKQNNNEFEKINQDELQMRRSYEYEERRGNLDINKDSFERANTNSKKESNKQSNENQSPNNNIGSNKLPDHTNQKASNESIHTENDDIVEEILVEDDDLFDKSDKKGGGSNNNFTISQSEGYDGTVDSNALERYNYIEPVDK